MQLCLLSASRNLGKELPILQKWVAMIRRLSEHTPPRNPIVDLIILLSEGANESPIWAVSLWLQCAVPPLTSEV